MERRPLSRDNLAVLLWPDSSLTEARAHLRRSLHDLAQKLPHVLESNYHTVQFNTRSEATVDLYLFQALVEHGDINSLQTAAALCRGQVLEGLAVDDCPEFDHWLLVERELWAMRCSSVLETLVALSERNGDTDMAMCYGWQLLGLQPWREDVHRQLMLFLARSGQTSMAVRQYRLCCKSLAEELGIEPSQETRLLFERVRRAAPVFSAVDLPSPARFIGRKDELRTLAAYLADPSCRLVTITGIHGVGKSRLAYEAGRQAAESRQRQFLDGVHAVRPRPAAARPVDLDAIGRALGITSQSETSAPVVLHFLRDREMLLILDDFEGVGGSVQTIRMLLDKAPDVKCIVTSDRPLCLPGERILPLAPLPSKAAGNGSPSDACLLLESAVERSAGRQLAAQETTSAARLCKLLDGWPLAIELAAGWCALVSCNQLLERLIVDPLSLAAAPDQNLSPLLGTMAQALDRTCSFLTQDERITLEQLAALGDPFDLESAAAEGITAGAVAEFLGRGLVRVELIERPGTAESRMRIQPLLRRYLLGHGSRLTVAVDRQASLLNLPQGRPFAPMITMTTPGDFSRRPEDAATTIRSYAETPPASG